MSTELADTTPSEGLERQCRPDEEIKWVVEKDMKTMILGEISSSVSMIVMTAVFGLFAAVFVATELGGASLALLTFVVVAFGPPLAKILYAIVNVKYGGVEYAATDDRFIRYREMLTSTSSNAVPIDRVRDAEYSEDTWDKVLGTGDIRIEGAQGDSLYFNNAPNGDALLRAVREEVAEADTVDVRNPQAASGNNG